MEKEEKSEKKKSLGKQFGLLFLMIALLTIVISGTFTYLNKTNSYHRECVTALQQLTDHLGGLIASQDSEFTDLKAYFDEHTDQVQIPVDFRADLPISKKAFYDYAIKHFDGRTPGAGLDFDDMDDEGKRLYVKYRFEYWFDLFFDSAEEFGLSYVYFVYPEAGEDHVMVYMFDPSMETRKGDDGTEILNLGDKVFEDPELHARMWEAWDTGKAPEAVDSIDNEYGYVYTYCQPVVVNGEKIGLICADASVDRINSEISTAVRRQVMIEAIIFAIATVMLYLFLKKKLLDRIFSLAGSVRKYAEKKDPVISNEIAETMGSNDELGALALRFSKMIMSLDEYMNELQVVTAEKERIGAELNVATRIQADMLPSIFPAFPDVPEIDLFASMDPAKEVGGDFYDFFMIDDTHLGLVIADVSGKGVPAALFMVIAKTLIKNQAMMGKSPVDVLTNVNDQLTEGNDSCLFVTVWLGIVDLETGVVQEANAGHENPAIRRKNGSYEFIKTKHSPAVAMMKGMKFRQTEFQMEPGDTLFVYTDGVPEATNANEELFGEERLGEALNRNVDASPSELLPAIRAEVDAFVGDAPQFDDLTMLAFHFTERNRNE